MIILYRYFNSWSNEDALLFQKFRMTEEAGGSEEEPVKYAGRFRTALPQVLI